MGILRMSIQKKGVSVYLGKLRAHLMSSGACKNLVNRK